MNVFCELNCQGKERKYIKSALLFVAEHLDSWTLFVSNFLINLWLNFVSTLITLN
jgi:hypothetical protein